ncbi:AMP-binding protein [Streptomyces brasiliensis]|nr:AMP-binding protein [Streptomyces brasiliensis]
MERFDAEAALALIERHRATHAQFVPTMFVRMLKLPEEVRNRYDLSSLRHAIHAAAPCPVDVKRAMIEWWGPILYEFYSSTEGMGATGITSEEWLRKPGSVGKPLMGTPYITDDDGNPLHTGEVGTIWFTGGTAFSYHGDPGKTAASHDDRGGTSVGDVGYIDEDGYLFLSDRRTHLIISGGVNIYPQEIEDALVMHPRVVDVAVVGVPDPEMGERVVALIQPCRPCDGGSRAGRRADRVRPNGAGGLQDPPRGAVHRRPAAHPHRQATQAPDPRQAARRAVTPVGARRRPARPAAHGVSSACQLAHRNGTVPRPVMLRGPAGPSAPPHPALRGSSPCPRRGPGRAR